MPLSGDFRGLGQLERNIGLLARVPSRAAAIAAPRIRARIEGQFARGVDPYGRAWAPLRPSTLAKGRRPPPLTDTRAMRDGVSVKPTPAAGIAITFAKEVPAIFHQKGTRYMKRREILPTNRLPAPWSQDIADSSRAAFRGTL